MSIILLVTLVIGMAFGWLNLGHFPFLSGAESAIFAIMLCAIGLHLGQDRQLWQRILQAGWRMLLFPLNIVIGTLLGCLLAAFVLRAPPGETMAIGAGYGWYSLAALLLNELDGARVAAIAFMANLFRELLGFIFIPVFARFRQGAISIAIGGATTMDTTLPLIARSTSPETAVYAFVNGVIVSSLVPLAIPLFHSL